MLETCTNIDFGILDIDEYADDTCTIKAYTNNPWGFILSIQGTDDGFYDSVHSKEWTKLATGTGSFDITPPTVEAWGWRIVNGTASEYSPGALRDTDNQPYPDNKFDNADYWHTVNYETSGGGTPYGDEAFFRHDSSIDSSAEFDLAFRAVTHFTSPGTYTDTITITISELYEPPI